jgi:hypothetical protein
LLAQGPSKSQVAESSPIITTFGDVIFAMIQGLTRYG